MRRNHFYTVYFFLAVATMTAVSNSFVIVPDSPLIFCSKSTNRCVRHHRILGSNLNHHNYDSDVGCHSGKDAKRSHTNTNTISTRRNLLLTTTAATGGLLVLGDGVANGNVANAAATTMTNYQTYNDEKYGFSITIPTTWNKMNEVTSLGDRRSIVVYTDPTIPSTSIIIVYTPIRDDYTSLNSFGSVDQVATQTILPKSTLFDEDSNVVAQMLSATSTKQSYIFDYIQQIPQQQQPLTHYRTIFTLCTPKADQVSSAGATLVTITLQTPESEYTTNTATTRTKDMFDTIIDSYQRT
jgi:hypothetical protein